MIKNNTNSDINIAKITKSQQSVSPFWFIGV